MAQFDLLVVFPLIWSLLIILFFYYRISIEMLIPDFFGAKKFREKKALAPSFSAFLKKNGAVQRDFSHRTLFLKIIMLNSILCFFKRNNQNKSSKVMHTLLFKEQFKYFKTLHWSYV